MLKLFKKKPQPIYLLSFEMTYKVKGDSEPHYNFFNVFTTSTTPPKKMAKILKKQFKISYKKCGCRLVSFRLTRTLNHSHPTPNNDESFRNI